MIERIPSIFFTKEESLVYCDDVNGLIRLMGIKYISKDWRLFIDSLNKSLNAVLLYNSNTIGYLPLAYSQKLKENYDNMELLLKLIKYDEQW